MNPKTRLGAALAAFTAALGWGALAIEFDRSLTGSLARGRGLAESLFLYFRFFTIITNIGIAVLMSVATLRYLTQRELPPARWFNAGLIYILVTCVTYEVMLRNQWAPHGMQMLTDTVIHDIVPVLTLVFWLGFAPRQGARWRDALWILAYPVAYFVMTLIAGALGEGYPYSFFDVDKLHYPTVFVVALIFQAVFYALGLVTTGLSMSWARAEKSDDARADALEIKDDRSPAV